MTVMFNGFKRKNAIDVVEALAGHEAGRLVLVDVREDSKRGGASRTCRSASSGSASASCRPTAPCLCSTRAARRT